MNDKIKENDVIQGMIELLYEKQEEINHEEFECLVGQVESGHIKSFEELAEFGVKKTEEDKSLSGNFLAKNKPRR